MKIQIQIRSSLYFNCKYVFHTVLVNPSYSLSDRRFNFSARCLGHVMFWLALNVAFKAKLFEYPAIHTKYS